MRRLLAVPLLIGAGFIIGMSDTDFASGQGKNEKSKSDKGKSENAKSEQAPARPARPPVNRPAPRPEAQPARPSPPASTLTPSRPQARPQPPQERPQQPPIGQRPNQTAPGTPGGRPGNQPISRPTTPPPVTPVRPGAGGGGQTSTQRPTPLPGAFEPPTRPSTRPTPPQNNPPGGIENNRPGGNSNNRPSILPSRPDLPNNRPGINLPNRPERPVQPVPPIGERPEIPNRPNRPGVTWPNRPDTSNPNRPDTGNPNRPGTRPPTEPKRPGGGTPPTIEWPNRPNRPGQNGDRPTVNNRPGLNQNGSHNTIVNRPNFNNNVTINNINNNSNYYSNSTNINNFGGYRGGVGRSIDNWHSSWNRNFNSWQRAYHPWYSGSWSGNLFNTWGVGPVSWGLGWWGLNSFRYWFGYTPFVNPFWVAPPVTVVVPQFLNYSQPIVNVVQALPDSGQEPPPMPETASVTFGQAREAFRAGDYKTALVKSEIALKDFPNDPVFQEFRALVLFALGEYKQSAAVTYALLASGPGWDWTTMSSLYSDIETYSNQLAALENAAQNKPDDPSLQFLLAYHYITIGDAPAAKEALARAQKLLPNDPLVAQLAQSTGAVSVPAAAENLPKAADINLDITGEWAAVRPDGGKIGLTITMDGTFTWSLVDMSGKKDSFDGTFSLEDDTLILERKAGGALMGRITPLAENKFLFRILGAGPADPGLTFTK